MTTITADDIRIELDAMNAPEHIQKFDFNSTTYGPIAPIWAVVAERTTGCGYDYEGAIVGLYESEETAEFVAEKLRYNEPLLTEDEDWTSAAWGEPMHYKVKELVMNAQPNELWGHQYYGAYRERHFYR